MKKTIALFWALCILFCAAMAEENAEYLILLGEEITLNGAPISSKEGAVWLDHVTENHEDISEDLAGIENRVVTITDSGVYRISGMSSDVQIAVKANEDDAVRLILDGADITCRTNAAIAVYSAADPRIAGEYSVTIELADGSKNTVTGSHNSTETDEEIEFDGAISSAVSLGFEGSGSLNISGDKEGVEVSGGHLTINGGQIRIESGDDPLNVSEDGFGVLTMNSGYVFSSVRPEAGGEGDGIDSNGWIVFNGGTAINLAHPTSQDGGIDSDMGSSINGGIIVGAGNMYDPIDSASGQLFMMLEFGQATNDLVVVTDEKDTPVFAYDFPYDYMYIAFSTPDLTEGIYHVYLGGEIEGEQTDGLYTSITSYTPGTLMQHGGGNAQQRNMGGFGGGMGGFPGGMERPEMPEGAEFPEGMERPEIPEGAELPEGMERPQMPEGAEFPEGMERPQMPEGAEFPEGMERPEMPEGAEFPEGMERPEIPEGAEFPEGMERPKIPEGAELPEGMPRPEMPGGGFGGMHGLQSSADAATIDFFLTKESTGFTNVRAAE